MKITKKDEKIIVGVYGSLREGLGNHFLLAHEEHIATINTDNRFRMFSMGAFPAVVETGLSGKGYYIKMELYEVSSRTLRDLDALEGFIEAGNPMNHYNRVNISMFTDWPQVTTYLYNKPEDWFVKNGFDEIEHGDWMKFVETGVKGVNRWELTDDWLAF